MRRIHLIHGKTDQACMIITGNRKYNDWGSADVGIIKVFRQLKRENGHINTLPVSFMYYKFLGLTYANIIHASKYYIFLFFVFDLLLALLREKFKM